MVFFFRGYTLALFNQPDHSGFIRKADDRKTLWKVLRDKVEGSGTLEILFGFDGLYLSGLFMFASKAGGKRPTKSIKLTLTAVI